MALSCYTKIPEKRLLRPGLTNLFRFRNRVLILGRDLAICGRFDRASQGSGAALYVPLSCSREGGSVKRRKMSIPTIRTLRNIHRSIARCTTIMMTAKTGSASSSDTEIAGPAASRVATFASSLVEFKILLLRLNHETANLRRDADSSFRSPAPNRACSNAAEWVCSGDADCKAATAAEVFGQRHLRKQ